MTKIVVGAATKWREDDLFATIAIKRKIFYRRERKSCFNRGEYTIISLWFQSFNVDSDMPARILEKSHENARITYVINHSVAFFFTVRCISSISSAIQQLKIANKDRIDLVATWKGRLPYSDRITRNSSLQYAVQNFYRRFTIAIV